jgi:hypothetical protein
MKKKKQMNPLANEILASLEELCVSINSGFESQLEKVEGAAKVLRAQATFEKLKTQELSEEEWGAIYDYIKSSDLKVIAVIGVAVMAAIGIQEG